MYNAGIVHSCKLRRRRIGPRLFFQSGFNFFATEDVCTDLCRPFRDWRMTAVGARPGFFRASKSVIGQTFDCHVVLEGCDKRETFATCKLELAVSKN
jgi:hypothetical protein